MITLKKLNVVKVVSSKEDAAKWQSKGFEIVEPSKKIEKDTAKVSKKNKNKDKGKGKEKNPPVEPKKGR